MIKALIRFIFFEIPSIYFKGLSCIFFDKEEIFSLVLQVRKQWRPDIKKHILNDYLYKCYKQVNEDEDE